MPLRGVLLDLVLRLGPVLYLAYMRFVFLTSKKSFHDFGPLWERLKRRENVLVAVLHQDTLLAPYAFRDKHIVTMTSLSRGGEVLARAMIQSGYKVFRESSSQGEREAVKEMVGHLKFRERRFCVMAVDGPRRPARKAKATIVVIAKHTGASIFPIRCGAKRRILNKSWDKTTIPLPFNRLVFCCGEPVSVERSAGRDEIEVARVAVGKELNELTARVEHYFNRTVQQEQDSDATIEQPAAKPASPESPTRHGYSDGASPQKLNDREVD